MNKHLQLVGRRLGRAAGAARHIGGALANRIEGGARGFAHNVSTKNWTGAGYTLSGFVAPGMVLAFATNAATDGALLKPVFHLFSDVHQSLEGIVDRGSEVLAAMDPVGGAGAEEVGASKSRWGGAIVNIKLEHNLQYEGLSVVGVTATGEEIPLSHIGVGGGEAIGPGGARTIRIPSYDLDEYIFVKYVIKGTPVQADLGDVTCIIPEESIPNGNVDLMCRLDGQLVPYIHESYSIGLSEPITINTLRAMGVTPQGSFVDLTKNYMYNSLDWNGDGMVDNFELNDIPKGEFDHFEIEGKNAGGGVIKYVFDEQTLFDANRRGAELSLRPVNELGLLEKLLIVLGISAGVGGGLFAWRRGKKKKQAGAVTAQPPVAYQPPQQGWQGQQPPQFVGYAHQPAQPQWGQAQPDQQWYQQQPQPPAYPAQQYQR